MRENISLIGAMLLIFAAVTFVAGTVPVAGEEMTVVPAPLENPTVCGYFRLREGFDRLMKGDAAADPAGSSVATAPERIFSNAFHAAARIRKQVRANALGTSTAFSKKKEYTGSERSEIVIRSIRSFCKARAFIPEDMFVYVRGPGEYAVMITGNITPQAWEDLFDASIRISRATGFTVNAVGMNGAADRSVLHVGPGYLLLAPAALEGNLLDALQAGAVLDGEKWKTFRSMVGLKPVAALEADMEGFLERSRKSEAGNALLPFPYESIRVLRCLVDARAIKAQLYTPDENARALLRQAAGEIAKALRAAATGSLFNASLDTLSESVQNTSVFIEGRGLDQNAPLAGVSTLGMLSQLICRAIPEANVE